MTQKQRLKELLFQRYTIPDNLDCLLGDAANEIQNLRSKLERQSTQLAEVLKEKDYMHTRMVSAELLLSHSTMREIDLKDALKKLRPEPRFRVGQVVFKNDFFKNDFTVVITARRYDRDGWYYDLKWRQGEGGSVAESSLRALTDAEK